MPDEDEIREEIKDEEPVMAKSTEPPVDPAPPVSDGHDEFPEPFERWLQTLRGTADEVFGHLLRTNHGRENHKPSEWTMILENYRNQPAHPDHPDYKG